MARKIATNTVGGREELLDFIRSRHRAIVITARADGRPQASPVTCGVDADGRIRYQMGGGPTMTGSHGWLSSPVSRLSVPARQA